MQEIVETHDAIRIGSSVTLTEMENIFLQQIKTKPGLRNLIVWLLHLHSYYLIFIIFRIKNENILGDCSNAKLVCRETNKKCWGRNYVIKILKCYSHGRLSWVQEKEILGQYLLCQQKEIFSFFKTFFQIKKNSWIKCFEMF